MFILKDFQKILIEFILKYFISDLVELIEILIIYSLEEIEIINLILLILQFFSC